jgi:site-specific recombinase XerD
MTTLPATIAAAGVPQSDENQRARPAWGDGLAAADDFSLGETAMSTRDSYRRDMLDFAAWCASVAKSALPATAETVAVYIATLAKRGLRPATIKRRLAAIGYAHRFVGEEPPTSTERVRSVHRGIRRDLGVRPEQKAAATAKVITKLLRRISGETLTAKRDRALILIGFAGALRRSELVGIDLEHLAFQTEGALISIPRSKTDQEGSGQSVAIPMGSKLHPVDALQRWIAAANIESGPIFLRIRKGDRLTHERLTPKSVALIIKRYAAAAKLNPDDWAGHSLRAGFVSEALACGADVFRIADQGRWRKLETVREYDRRLQLFKNNAGKAFL